MRDLEIRGAGNILGADQSGHIAAVGYDLYVQLVAEAVAEARGEARPTPPSVSIDVPGDAHLPEGLRGGRGCPARGLPAPGRRPAPVADVEDIGAEWVDRYGPLPATGARVCWPLARLRAGALARGIREIAMSPVRPGGTRQPVVRVAPVALPASAQVRLRRLAPGATYREDSAQLLVPDHQRGLPGRRGARCHRRAVARGPMRAPTGTPCSMRGA